MFLSVISLWYFEYGKGSEFGKNSLRHLPSLWFLLMCFSLKCLWQFKHHPNWVSLSWPPLQCCAWEAGESILLWVTALSRGTVPWAEESGISVERTAVLSHSAAQCLHTLSSHPYGSVTVLWYSHWSQEVSSLVQGGRKEAEHGWHRGRPPSS